MLKIRDLTHTYFISTTIVKIYCLMIVEIVGVEGGEKPAVTVEGDLFS